MSEPQKVTEFFEAINIHRELDGWCEPCAASSIYTGPFYKVTLDGVSVWGTLRVCVVCRVRIWTTLNGNVIPVVVMNDRNTKQT